MSPTVHPTVPSPVDPTMSAPASGTYAPVGGSADRRPLGGRRARPAPEDDGTSAVGAPADWRRTALLALAAGAACFAVAFPPFGLVLPAIVALVPFAVTIARQVEQGARGRDAALFGLLFGVAVYAVNILWVGSAYYRDDGGFAWPAYAGGMLCVVLPTALATWAFRLARSATGWPLALLLPVTWTALEVLLEHLPDVAFPWLPLGLALAPHPLLAQVADVSGVHGASFAMALVAGLVADSWLLRRSRGNVARRLGGVAALVLVVGGYGAWRLATVEAHAVATVAVVQPSVGLGEKHDPELLESNVGRHVALTRSAGGGGEVDLVLWPETALAGMLGAHPSWADSVRAAAAAVGAPLIFGVVDIERLPDGNVAIYNAALLADAAGNLGGQAPYRKRALVPVAERIPFINPAWFTGGDPATSRGFGRGTSDAPFTLPFGAVGTLICFESAFPALSRAYRRNGADLLVNITNDAAFRGGRGAHQHLAQLTMRAIETRAGIVRAANTGVSGYVDPLGRLHGATAMDERVARSYEVRTTRMRSPYVLLGDWVGVICVLVATALAIHGLRARRSVVRAPAAR